MRSEQIYLSVVMPGYNEAKCVKHNIIQTMETIKSLNRNFEIIFVDDGSTDHSLSEASSLLTSYSNLIVVGSEKNMGKGNALKLGVAAANGECIAFLDADLDISPIQILNYLDILSANSADAVIASKFHKESQLHYPLLRRLMSYGYFLFLFLMFQLDLKDTQTGLKVFKATPLKRIFPYVKVNRFAFDIEILVLLKKCNYIVMDAPVKIRFARGRKWGRIKLIDILNVFTDTVGVFLRFYFLKSYDGLLVKSEV